MSALSQLATERHRLGRLLDWIAGAAALFAAVGIPTTVTVVAYSMESSHLRYEAQVKAADLSRFIYSHPDLWEFQAARFDEILDAEHSAAERLHPRHYRLVHIDGHEILSTQSIPPAPRITRSAPLTDGRRIVGTVEVAMSLRDVAAMAGVAAVVGAALATAILLALRFFPARVLNHSLRSLAASEARLEQTNVRLSRIMDNVSEGILSLDGRGTVETVNRAAVAMFGYPEDVLRGRPASILLDDAYHDDHARFVATLPKGEPGPTGGGPRETVGRRRDGSVFPIEIEIIPVIVGARRAHIAVARDISERQKAESRLRQAQRMEAVGHLTGGIAHDFNNLLMAVLGNLDLLEEHVEGRAWSARAIALVEKARAAALKGADLTGRLLAFSRKQALRPVPADVNRLIREMRELAAPTLGEHITIDTVLAGDLWPALVDPGQLDQALLNLAINARDAMAGGGTLTIETANACLDEDSAAAHDGVAPGDYVTIAVRDTGTGIDDDVIGQVFEPFFTTKDVGKGSGLGLSMVYGFVRQSGGYVDIATRLGAGTTVKLYLPRAAKDAAATSRRRGATLEGHRLD